MLHLLCSCVNYCCFSIALTKLDVLDDLKEIKIGVAYKHNGECLPAFPGEYNRQPALLSFEACIFIVLFLATAERGSMPFSKVSKFCWIFNK